MWLQSDALAECEGGYFGDADCPSKGHQRPNPEAVPSRLQTFGDHQQTED